MEWMDPMSWRLPSGKDLAEFALQAGFLAPMMLERPNLKRKKAPAPAPASPVVAESQARGGAGTFRQLSRNPSERSSVDRDSGGTGGDDR